MAAKSDKTATLNKFTKEQRYKFLLKKNKDSKLISTVNFLLAGKVSSY